jgi:predicted DNA-binding transcriptional regulator AlpA
MTPAHRSSPDTAGAGSSPTVAWSADRIRALGTVTDVPTAAAIFGISRSVAYDLVKAGAFPVPVLRFGTRYRIPVAAILAALHMPPTSAADCPNPART